MRIGAPVLGVFVGVAACAAPQGGYDEAFERGASVEIWHVDDEGGVRVIHVAQPAARAHLAHGDWTNPIHVDPDAAPGGSGLPDAPVGRLTDAIALAAQMRAATGETEEATRRIAIRAAPGVYKGSFSATALAVNPGWEPLPLILDVPGVDLLGSTEVALDDDGLPTGAYAAGTASRLVADAPLVGTVQSLVYVTDTTHADGASWAGNGATVAGWVFESGHAAGLGGGIAVATARVEGVRIADSIARRFASVIEARYTGLEIDGLYARTTSSCTVCLPGCTTDVSSSRIQDGLVGVFVTSSMGLANPSLGTHTGRTVAPTAVPAHASATLRVEDSDLTGHTRNKISSGLRVVALGPASLPAIDTSTVDVVVRRTRFGDSFNGVGIDGGFVEWVNNDVASDITVSLEDNEWSSVSQAPIYATFTRGQIAVQNGLAVPGSTPYMAGAEWSIDRSGADAGVDVWIDHPEFDPYGDAHGATDPLGNTLTIDGVTREAPVCDGAWPAVTCTPP